MQANEAKYVSTSAHGNFNYHLERAKPAGIPFDPNA
ncbi:hypothetical protein GA0115259_100109 [Streptomyces sp. MnatMP-M17]|nr:hypothetical protein GA0115259_100109 [Streptomyces sp. MnatMP-M17]